MKRSNIISFLAGFIVAMVIASIVGWSLRYYRSFEYRLEKSLAADTSGTPEGMERLEARAELLNRINELLPGNIAPERRTDFARFMLQIMADNDLLNELSGADDTTLLTALWVFCASVDEAKLDALSGDVPRFPRAEGSDDPFGPEDRGT